MMINEITATAGANKRRKRVGRGESSGLGKTCGRGTKGMQSRAGNAAPPLSEGGATPLYRRMPKRGFSNYEFRDEYQPVNLDDLELLFESGETIDLDALRKHRLIDGAKPLVKLLARGEIKKKLVVTAHAASAAARAAIEKAGGELRLLPLRDVRALAKSKRNSAKNRKREARPTRLEKKRAAANG